MQLFLKSIFGTQLYGFKYSYLIQLNIYLFEIIANFINVSSKVGDRSRGWPEGSLFNSYYTEV